MFSLNDSKYILQTVAGLWNFGKRKVVGTTKAHSYNHQPSKTSTPLVQVPEFEQSTQLPPNIHSLLFFRLTEFLTEHVAITIKTFPTLPCK